MKWVANDQTFTQYFWQLVLAVNVGWKLGPLESYLVVNNFSRFLKYEHFDQHLLAIVASFVQKASICWAICRHQIFAQRTLCWMLANLCQWPTFGGQTFSTFLATFVASVIWTCSIVGTTFVASVIWTCSIVGTTFVASVIWTCSIVGTNICCECNMNMFYCWYNICCKCNMNMFRYCWYNICCKCNMNMFYCWYNICCECNMNMFILLVQTFVASVIWTCFILLVQHLLRV